MSSYRNDDGNDGLKLLYDTADVVGDLEDSVLNLQTMLNSRSALEKLCFNILFGLFSIFYLDFFTIFYLDFTLDISAASRMNFVNGRKI